MASGASTSLTRQLGALFEGGSTAGLSDRQPLERFATARDEAAFAALVTRHGPMVLGVCRQLLGDHQHAEDAFQATFLVLARKAGSLREPDLLGNWLYGVALRTARKARCRLARRRRTEEAGALGHPKAHPAVQAEQVIDHEQAEALHREIDRLPDAFRRAVVLCYFEGLSPDEAAARLRWPSGTLRSRLVRAREKLRRGLARRGVVLSTTAMAGMLSPRSASASVSSLLCDSTTRAAIAFATRHATAGGALAAAALAREVLRSMLIHKLKLTAMALCLLAVVATGAGWFIRPPARAADPQQAPAAAQAPTVSKRDDPDPRPAPGRMTVAGRVLDPEGKPVPSASVMVYGALKQGGERPGAWGPAAIGHAAGDASGRYRLDMPRISSSTHHIVGVAARAPGFGMGWVNLDVDADQPVADIALRPEQVIEGRLFDIKGRVVPGARVSVEGMGQPPRGPEALPYEVEGPHLWGEGYARTPPAWPAPAITDAEGRFTVRGIGRDLRALLMAEDPRFAGQRILVDTDRTAGTRTITAVMEPAKFITGRVTYADTGKPVPHAAIKITSFEGGPATGRTSHCETDAEGYYRANTAPANRYVLLVYVPEGQPYLNAATELMGSPKEEIEHRMDLVLRRGTVLRGKVIEEGTGRPVAGAQLRYMGRSAKPDESSSRNGDTRTSPDGSYQLAVLPSPGTLIVHGPSEDYMLEETGERMVREGRPGGPRWYAHAFIPCDLKPGTDCREVDVVLRRGTTVKGRVLGPDGQPVREAWMLSRVLLLPQPWPWRHYWGDYHGDVRNGRCELHGLAQGTEVPVFFLDPRNQLGATAIFSVKAAKDGPITVRLRPCGLAMARLVDPSGKPIAGYRDPFLISIVVTPGPDRSSRAEADKGLLAADQDYLSRIDPERYADLVSDDRGRITFPALIPGATYRIRDDSADENDDPTPPARLRKEFVARSGEAIELGDILIEKPEP